MLSSRLSAWLVSWKSTKPLNFLSRIRGLKPPPLGVVVFCFKGLPPVRGTLG